jgi:hypothetical protein
MPKPLTFLIDGQHIAAEYSDDKIHWVSADTPGALFMRYARGSHNGKWIIYEDVQDYGKLDPAWFSAEDNLPSPQQRDAVVSTADVSQE